MMDGDFINPYMTKPTDYMEAPTPTSPAISADPNADRNKRLAALLQQQSKAAGGTQYVHGWAVPQSPLADITQVGTGLASQYMKQNSGL